MTRHSHILGCLLGTAVGDAAGLRREGLTRRRARRIYGSAVAPTLIGGCGLCSDDTEHTMMMAHSLTLAVRDPDVFERDLANQFKLWLLSLPAGIGFATLRACLKLVVGFRPDRCGVFSAGNGPSMRSALIGVTSISDEECVEFVRRSTRLTHTDPKAMEGAMVVARAAGLAANNKIIAPVEFLHEEAKRVEGAELKEHLAAAHQALLDGLSPVDFCDSRGWDTGVSGYVNQTVPAALYCWAASPLDYRQCVTDAVLLGGDTDSVAAIAGAVSGANLGEAGVPVDWVSRLSEWPRNVTWMKHAARTLSDNFDGKTFNEPPSMRWIATIPRNMLFAAIVISLGVRRLLPPY